ncbi:MAG: MFS transporter [Bacteroidales bacterium]|nr:MFS transporter [Bacteroidales bacterium]
MGRRSGRFQKGRIITISAAHFIHDVYTSFLAPALPRIIEKLDTSYALIGLLAPIQRIPSLLNPFVGIIAERPVMKYMVIFSPALTALTMSLIGIAPGYIFLAVLLFVSGLSSTFWHIPTPVMVKELSGERTGKAMSFYMVGGELARTVGPLVIMGVIGLWGLEGAWRMMPFGFIASLVLYLNFRNERLSANNGVRSNHEGSYWKIFLRFSPAFILTGGFTFFQAGVKSAVTFWLPTYLELSEGYSYIFADISLAVLQLAGAAGALMSGTISDKLGRNKTLCIISLSTPLLMLLFINLNGYWIFPVLIPLGFFMFAPTAVMLALVQDLSSEKKAFLNGIYMTINFFISTIVYPLVGIMIDHLGFTTSYYIFGLLSFGAFFVILLIRKKLEAVTDKSVQTVS